jgi:hypothetical protein
MYFPEFSSTNVLSFLLRPPGSQESLHVTVPEKRMIMPKNRFSSPSTFFSNTVTYREEKKKWKYSAGPFFFVHTHHLLRYQKGGYLFEVQN